MTAPNPVQDHLQIVMTGHVDHGKSSLLGRLYMDAGIIPPSLMARVQDICDRQGKAFEHAFLFDAFLEEQEQGITIDMARTFFAWEGRRYAILDAPGHREFLKNMVTGASRAEAAVLVIDAAEGVMDQSRRHGYLLKLLGIPQVAVVVNKMDLLGYGQAAFERVQAEYTAFLGGLGMVPMAFVPASARDGENVVRRDGRMAWYHGPTVLEALGAFQKPLQPLDGPLRFMVQDVYKFDERRILAGRVESGTLRPGERLVFLPSGKSGVVRRLERFPEGAPPESAPAGTSTGLTLVEQSFLERGEVACREAEAPEVSDRFRAHVFWMGREPLRLGHRYTLRLGTQEVGVEVEAIHHSLDASSLESREAPGGLNRYEAGEVVLRTLRLLALDPYQVCATTGRFVLVAGYDIQGGGIVTEVLASARDRLRSEALAREQAWREGAVSLVERRHRNGHGPALILFAGSRGSGKAKLARALERRLFEAGRQTVLLDSRNLRSGLSSDLPMEAGEESLRRFGEAAALLLHAGLVVVCVTNHLQLEAHPLLKELAAPHPVLTVRLLGEGEALPEDGTLGVPIDLDLDRAMEDVIRVMNPLIQLEPSITSVP